MYKILSICLLFSLISNADTGCLSSVAERHQDECSENDIVQKSSSILDNINIDNKKKEPIKIVKITKDLKNVKFFYQGKEFLIERKIDIKEQSCPPHCIQSIGIGSVKTVGELEVLDFIQSMQEKKGRIFIDARAVAEYKRSSIPSAINIPHAMLDLESKYRDEILRLLGARKLQNKWYFRNIHKLLIFDNGILDTRATKIIESLIDIGYPQDEILYYRGGLSSWRNLGLTLL